MPRRGFRPWAWEGFYAMERFYAMEGSYILMGFWRAYFAGKRK